MLLTLDIGNTNVTAGVFDGESLAANWRLATDAHRLTDEYALQLRDLLPMKGVRVEDVRDVAICSVVPQLTGVFDEVAAGYPDIETDVLSVEQARILAETFQVLGDPTRVRIVHALSLAELCRSPRM